MHGHFLQDLATVMIVAGFVTVIFHRMRLPVVLGYILAGFIVGPNTPAIPISVNDHQTVEIMSELGMILLMFSLGLHFSLRNLAKVGGTAVIAAVLEIVIMAGIGYAIGRAFGWRPMDSLFLGAILSISSTTIIIKALGDLGRSKEKFAELIFGILVVEDILAIAMLALLSGIAVTGELQAIDVFLTLGQLVIFLASLLIFGLLAVPPLLRYLSRFKSDEMMLVAALGLCFGVSLLAMKLGYSVALGAFLIGAIVAEARERGKIEALIEPVRDMFSAVFFVAIGMLIQPKMLATHALPIIVITIAVVVGKVASCSVGTFLAGQSATTSLRVGMGLAQIGEFSFIIATLGREKGVTSEFLYPIAVTVSAITTLLTPFLITSSDRFAGLLSRKVPGPIAGYAQVYHAWASRMVDTDTAQYQIRRLLRKWGLQILLNMALVTGFFIAAAALASKIDYYWTNLPDWMEGSKPIAWLAAMVASMPLLIVSHRKLRAIALISAEAAITTEKAKEQTQATRNLVAATIRILGSVIMVLWLLILSTAVMPPWPLLVGLCVIIGIIVTFYWQTFERVYAKAQINLQETLMRPAEACAPFESLHVPTVLQMAKLETIEITEHSPAKGRLIRELELRSRSGASAVGIERGDGGVSNPGPDEELLVGDRVLLLGNENQLLAAKSLLTKGT